MAPTSPVSLQSFEHKPIERMCATYAMRRDSLVQSHEIGHIGFAQFCNDMGKLFLHVLGRNCTEPMIRQLYRMATSDLMAMDTPQTTIAFRELLGIAVGLYETKQVRDRHGR